MLSHEQLLEIEARDRAWSGVSARRGPGQAAHDRAALLRHLDWLARCLEAERAEHRLTREALLDCCGARPAEYLDRAALERGLEAMLLSLHAGLPVTVRDVVRLCHHKAEAL